jgi:hypothetical protein
MSVEELQQLNVLLSKLRDPGCEKARGAFSRELDSPAE